MFKIFAKGFTIVELLVSMGILAVIFAISTITLSTIIPNTSSSTSTDTLMSDLRSQQTMAMSNDSYYGVHFETNSYTLFKGNTYDPSNVSNFSVALDPTVTFANITLPGNQIVFTPGSGDVAGYLGGFDSFQIKNIQTGKTTDLRINTYGATY